jgi:DNA polymerase III epsilon subunit-like protein
MTFARKPLVFVDIETTGLDPEIHEIIEIAILPLKGPVWQTKIKPEHLDVASPKALEINGYQDHPEDWEDAPRFLNIAPEIAAHLKDTMIAGQNTQFDMGFIRSLFKRHDLPLKGVPYSWVDTVSLAYEHLVPLGTPDLKLGTTCDFLGISNDGQHTAAADVYRTREAYLKMIRAGWFKRLWWRLRWKLKGGATGQD